MNKAILLIIGGVIAVGAAAFIFLNNNSSNPQNGEVQDQTENTAQNQDTAETADMMMSAFEGSGSVRCTYQDETSQATAYIKNGMVRVESAGSQGSEYGNAILKNDTVWTWNTAQTEGYVLENLSDYQGDSQAAEQYAVTTDDVQNEIEQNQANCNEESISDSMFEPPANVNFQNVSSMMEDVQDQIPEGYEIPEDVNLPEGN